MTYTDKEMAPPTGLVISIEGEEKTGKTWLALSSLPEPIVYINCDRNNARLVSALRAKGRKILTAGPHLFIPMPTDDILRQSDRDVLGDVARRALVPWKALKTDYLTALKDPKVRSIVVDSGTQAYVMCRLGRFGKLLEVAPVLYSKTNFEFSNLLNIGHDSDKTVVWINRIGEEYSRGADKQGREISRKTGGMKTLGYKEFNFAMDAVIRTEISQDGEFSAAIYREGVGRPGLNGMVFAGDMLSMPKILGKITGTKSARWV